MYDFFFLNRKKNYFVSPNSIQIMFITFFQIKFFIWIYSAFQQYASVITRVNLWTCSVLLQYGKSVNNFLSIYFLHPEITSFWHLLSSVYFLVNFNRIFKWLLPLLWSKSCVVWRGRVSWIERYQHFFLDLLSFAVRRFVSEFL